MRRLRLTPLRLALLLALLTAVGGGIAAASTLSISSARLWGASQTLTKGTCTLIGSTQATDTYVDQSHATTSYSTSTTLNVQPNTSAVMRTLIKFDLSSCGIPATGGADSATLKLVEQNAPSTYRTLDIRLVTSTWSSPTWNTAPTYSQSNTTQVGTGVTDGVTLSIPVTTDVDSFIKGTTTNNGWAIVDSGSTGSGNQTVLDSTQASSSLRPQLVISYEK